MNVTGCTRSPCQVTVPHTDFQHVYRFSWFLQIGAPTLFTGRTVMLALQSHITALVSELGLVVTGHRCYLGHV